jgi:DNA-binding CsgD family transcriptional regulator
LDAAAALEDFADLQAQAPGEPGTPALEEALRRYSLCGARADAARVRSRLGAGDANGRGEAEGPPGWERLTRAQRVVADLVADGLSNREVAERLKLSPHTVSDHLRQVFGKLEVHSRLRLIQLRHGHSA